MEITRHTEIALSAGVQKTGVDGVSICETDDLFQAVGLGEIDIIAVFRTGTALDKMVREFCNRLGGEQSACIFGYALLESVKKNDVLRLAMVNAIVEDDIGVLKILNFGMGANETDNFMREFLRSLG